MVAGKVLDGGYSISIEKGREFQKSIYFCFIDYAKVGQYQLNGHEFEQVWETVKDKEAWPAAIHRVSISWT